MCSFSFIQRAALHQSFTWQSSKMKTDFVVCTCSFKVTHNCFFSSDYSQRTLGKSFLDTSKRRQIWKGWAVCKDYPHLLFPAQVWVIWVSFFFRLALVAISRRSIELNLYSLYYLNSPRLSDRFIKVILSNLGLYKNCKEKRKYILAHIFS